MTQQNEQQRNRMLSLLREGERRMLVQLAGLLRTSVDEINAELEKEELLSALEQPITVEYLNGVVQRYGQSSADMQGAGSWRGPAVVTNLMTVEEINHVAVE